MLSVDDKGTVTLPDGRVVHTVAACPFYLAGGRHPVAYAMIKAPGPSRVDEVDKANLRVMAHIHAEDKLKHGETVVMWGIAEGRLLPDGATVATKAAYWQVCAL
jgi:hypothetical protein